MALKKILLVDDHEAEHFLLKAMVSDYDDTIEVLSAYDGEEGLEILKKEHETLDCILLDINMPRMNGFEFLDTYAEMYPDDASHTIVAMLTSSSQEADRERAMSYDCVRDFFIKPIGQKNLEILSSLI